jgi:hypothetical protein
MPLEISHLKFHPPFRRNGTVLPDVTGQFYKPVSIFHFILSENFRDLMPILICSGSGHHRYIYL